MMQSNLDYLYNHLPARYRRKDENLFLKRFLSFFGSELDAFEFTIDTFNERLNPETATEGFIDWWLWSMFGWGWFPVWFTLEQKRVFYANIAKHYARRGTKRGIEEFLAAFGITARVFNAPTFWGEWTWGEDFWAINAPLGIIVQVFPEAAATPADYNFWGEFTWGEDHFAEPGETLERADIDQLLRFQWPLGQVVMIEDKTPVSV